MRGYLGFALQVLQGIDDLVELRDESLLINRSPVLLLVVVHERKFELSNYWCCDAAIVFALMRALFGKAQIMFLRPLAKVKLCRSRSIVFRNF
ncbi:hypothetical protein C0Q88_23385 [Ralstonia pickettii]|uniref:Uncharacterized protein n=1 Tax=Ralstonia pickettii TaxID=329 RepID=A0A2N4TKT4_RALPI|nr:hypothetical protein [Ralstonia pickettii]PLC40304.1 hypothetical protein C0Q88_23385 [Ralstonia pickettii]